MHVIKTINSTKGGFSESILEIGALPLTLLISYTRFLFQPVSIMSIEYLVCFCENNEHGLWYTCAIGKPLSKILLVAAALQLMSTRYRHGKKN